MLSTNEYFTKLTFVSEELRQAGVIVDDGKLFLIAPNGLDQSYDPFVTAQTAQVEDISFSSILGLVLSYESRLNHHHGSKEIVTTNAIQTSSSVVVCQICDK